jgi:hypothetical protein
VLLSVNFARRKRHCYFTIKKYNNNIKLRYPQLQLFWYYFDEQQLQSEVAAAVACTETLYRWEHHSLW